MKAWILLQAIVALGDSVTLGVRRDGSVTADQTFAALLEKQWGRPVINAGIGGNHTAQMLDRLDRDVLARKPAVVLIMAGLNDAAFIDPGPLARTWPRVSREAYGRNLREIVARVKAAGAKPVLMTPNPMTRKYPYAELGFYAGNDINHALADYVVEAREAAVETGACLVDVYRDWTSDPGHPELLPDGIHPDARGHRRIADRIDRDCGPSQW